VISFKERKLETASAFFFSTTVMARTLAAMWGCLANCSPPSSNLAMKHAGPTALDRLEPLLAQLRRRERLKEKSRGVFYLAGRAFLHFHEHGEGELHADIRLKGDDFDRFDITRAADRAKFLALVDKAVSDGKPAPKR
jgi:hypothetical protein